MLNREFKKINLPDSPGVYFFKAGKSILYIGKATSLKDRVRSYFNTTVISTRGAGIVSMVEQADKISFIETDSVLEALILEASQIKKHRPKYNVKEKDDKSFNFVVITKEVFPRVLLARGKELRENEELASQIKFEFGPFPRGSELKEALKIIRKIFPYRDKCQPNSGKPCFYAQIGLCPGVCYGNFSAIEYAETIKNLKSLFEGKKKDIIKDMERQMKILAIKQQFEKAGEIKRKIFTLNHIQDIALIKSRSEESFKSFRIEAYDIAHLSGKDTVGVMAVVLAGEVDKSAYRKFTIKGKGKDTVNDIANLKEVLVRRFNHGEWILPQLIVLDGGVAQLNAAQNVLKSLDLNIPTVSVVKDEFHRPRQILGDSKIKNKFEREIILANSEAHRFAIHFHRQIRGRVI